MKTLRSYFVWFAVMFAAGCFATGARAASVNSSGYTNDFVALPPVTDWSYFSIAGGSGTVIDAAGLDAAVQAVTAGTVNTVVGTDAGDPPAFNAAATWSSAGLYLQTRPTGNNATFLMCTLVNDLGSSSTSIHIQYTLTSVQTAAEEVPAHLVYYSLSGTANSWIPIPALSVTTPACCYVSNMIADVTLGSAWNVGATLYLAFADDNGSGSPDIAYQIDNFSFKATPTAPAPIVITSQPTNLTVVAGQQASFTVGASGYPITYRWYKSPSATPIAGAVAATFTIPTTTAGSAGSYFCVLSNQTSGNVTSRVATLSVNTDIFPPILVSAISGTALTSVTVGFSEIVTSLTANNRLNYVITISGTTNRLNVSTAVLQAGSTKVVLTTTARVPGTSYTLTVSGIKDAAGNTIATNSQVLIAFEDIVLPMNATWRYDQSGDLGTAWRVKNYNDAAWPSGPALLGVETAGLPAPGLQTGLTLGNPTYYFRSHFNFNGYTNGAILRLRHIVDDGAVFYLNGKEILRYQIAAGTVTYGTFTPITVGDAVSVGPVDLRVDNLLVGDNVLAVEVHQAASASSDIVFGLEIQAHIESVPFGPVVITNQPASITVVEGQPATFGVDLTGALPRSFQWFSNNVSVAGATNQFFTIPFTPLSASGSVFRVSAGNSLGGSVSSNATLKVVPDVYAPVLLAANFSATLDSVLVNFSERITAATAQNISNYRITNFLGATLQIFSATLVDETNVLLSVAVAGKNRHILRVSGVRDVSVKSNLILPNSGVSIGATFTLIALSGGEDQPWWFYDLAETDPGFGTNWRTVAYNELANGWVDPATDLPLKGQGIFFRPDASVLPGEGGTGLLGFFGGQAHATYYFRHHFSFLGETNGVVLRIRHVIDDGAVFYLNGQEVLRFNMALGPVVFFSTAVGVGTAAVEGPFTIPSSALVAGTNNVLAVEVHQSGAGSTDAAFAAELTANLLSEQLIDFIPHLDIARTNIANVKNVRITWSIAGYRLHQADFVTGPWTPVTSAVSGYTVPAASTKKFYRLLP